MLKFTIFIFSNDHGIGNFLEKKGVFGASISVYNAADVMRMTMIHLFVLALTPVLDMLNDLYLQAQLIPVDVVLLDKKQYLALLDQSIKLQQISRQLFRFVKLVQDNATVPFLKATAELEMSNLLQIATNIELPEMTAATTRARIMND